MGVVFIINLTMWNIMFLIVEYELILNVYHFMISQHLLKIYQNDLFTKYLQNLVFYLNSDKSYFPQFFKPIFKRKFSHFNSFMYLTSLKVIVWITYTYKHIYDKQIVSFLEHFEAQNVPPTLAYLNLCRKYVLIFRIFT